MNAQKHTVVRPHPRRRHARIGLFTACLLAGAIWLSPSTSALLEEGVVRTLDGKTFEGDIVERDGEVEVTANGIMTRLPAENIASIEYGSPEERLRRQLEAVAAHDYEERLAVARQAMNRDLLDLAEEIAGDVQNDDPDNAEAGQLLDQIARRRQIKQTSGTGVRRGRPDEGAAGAATRAFRPGDLGLLDDHQINLIRQVELQPADAVRQRNRVRVSFRDGAINRFVESQQGLSFRAFNRQDDIVKAIYILESDVDRSLKDDVVITSEPASLLSYLREVEPIILNGCATSGCHGSRGEAAFMLYPNARDVATSYTNYYYINTYSRPIENAATGAFGEGPVSRRLVDRVNVDQSLLLNYMLPRDAATFPHPEVRGFTPVATNVSAETFQTVRTWIAQVLRPLPADGYGFEFNPDVPPPTTAPTTGPTTQPDEPAAAPGDPTTRSEAENP